MYKIIDMYPYLRALQPEHCSCSPKENICVFICGTVPAISYNIEPMGNKVNFINFTLQIAVCES